MLIQRSQPAPSPSLYEAICTVDIEALLLVPVRGTARPPETLCRGEVLLMGQNVRLECKVPAATLMRNWDADRIQRSCGRLHAGERIPCFNRGAIEEDRQLRTPFYLCGKEPVENNREMPFPVAA